MLTWTSDDGGLAISVKFDRYDYGRVQYEYRIYSEGIGLPDGSAIDHRASDLRSGSNEEINEPAMLRTLSSFIGAYVESNHRPDRPGENADLFPAALAEVLTAYADEFATAMRTYEDAS